MERAIHISSIKREKTGENRPDNFLLKFNPSLKLNPEKKHFLAIDRLTITYSWYNIRSSYNNNTIKYTNDRGANWNTITFKETDYGTKLPNITNSIDVLNINTTAITDSIVDGVNTNTIAMIPTDYLTRSYPFTFEPRRPLYCPVSSHHMSEMRFYVSDSLGRPVDFSGIDWFMTLLLHSR